MKDYLVSGHSRKDVCEKYQMNNGYFSTTLGPYQLNVLVARLAPYYTDSVSAIAETASCKIRTIKTPGQYIIREKYKPVVK